MEKKLVRMTRKRTVIRMTAIILLFLMAVTAAFAESAITNEENGRETDMPENEPDRLLTLFAGFPDWEYRDFIRLDSLSADDMMQKMVCEQDYTFYDPDHGVFVDHAMGMPVHDLLESVSIDAADVSGFLLRTGSGEETFLSADDLLFTGRYGFYDLPEYYDPETGNVDEKASVMKQPVETILAFQECWMTGEEFLEDDFDEDSMTGRHAFRLIPGQKDYTDRTMQYAIAEITEIYVVMEGKPSMRAVPETIRSKPGTSVAATIQMDSLGYRFLEEADVRWSSSDVSVAQVDGNGTVTLLREGTAEVTVSAGGMCTSIRIRPKFHLPDLKHLLSGGDGHSGDSAEIVIPEPEEETDPDTPGQTSESVRERDPQDSTDPEQETAGVDDPSKEGVNSGDNPAYRDPVKSEGTLQAGTGILMTPPGDTGQDSIQDRERTGILPSTMQQESSAEEPPEQPVLYRLADSSGAITPVESPAAASGAADASAFHDVTDSMAEPYGVHWQDGSAGGSEGESLTSSDPGSQNYRIYRLFPSDPVDAINDPKGRDGDPDRTDRDKKGNASGLQYRDVFWSLFAGAFLAGGLFSVIRSGMFSGKKRQKLHSPFSHLQTSKKREIAEDEKTLSGREKIIQ